MLPLYSGTAITNKDADITIGIENQYHNSDYIIKLNWNEISNKKNIIHILEENTSVLCIGNKPIHMTSLKISNNYISVNGHSIMMGYINKKNNATVFKNNSMIIKNNSK